MITAEYQESWEKMLEIIIDAGIDDKFRKAVLKSAEVASRAAAATYQDERLHLRMSVKAEICYELADAVKRAQEASETKAKVEEAERIRDHLAGLCENTVG